MRLLGYTLIIAAFLIINLPVDSSTGIVSANDIDGEAVLSKSPPTISPSALALKDLPYIHKTHEQRKEITTNYDGTSKTGTFSCYTSRVEECDSDPFTTASGKRVYKGMVANNDWPFGTKIRILGYGTYEVQDRMNRRYTGTNTWDIWFEDLEECKNFGRRELEYIIIK